MIPGRSPFLVRNLPAVMLVLAILLGALGRPHGDVASRFLAWVLLLPIGIVGPWAGIAHVALPPIAADHIGWAVSLFQYEGGMADLAVGGHGQPGVLAVLGVSRRGRLCRLDFPLGYAAGHIRQTLVANNFSPGNAGVPFYTDIIRPLLATGLWIASRRTLSPPVSEPSRRAPVAPMPES